MMLKDELMKMDDKFRMVKWVMHNANVIQFIYIVNECR